MSEPADWIAPTGVRAIDPDVRTTGIPDAVLNDDSLSLTARGLYALVLEYQGEPVDPYEDAVQSYPEIASAIEELIERSLVLRVSR